MPTNMLFTPNFHNNKLNTEISVEHLLSTAHRTNTVSKWQGNEQAPQWPMYIEIDMSVLD